MRAFQQSRLTESDKTIALSLVEYAYVRSLAEEDNHARAVMWLYQITGIAPVLLGECVQNTFSEFDEEGYHFVHRPEYDFSLVNRSNTFTVGGFFSKKTIQFKYPMVQVALDPFLSGTPHHDPEASVKELQMGRVTFDHGLLVGSYISGGLYLDILEKGEFEDDFDKENNSRDGVFL